MTNSPFPYGASYSPLIFPATEWERDLGLMQAAGMNLVRIGDVHGSWDRIEPQEGTFRLDELAAFYQAAAKFNIRVMLSTGAASPPLWLARKYPDVSILSSRGERYPLGASYHWACVHHPGYREAAERYVQKLAAFAITQPNHHSWQITNEIGFPFMPARDRDNLGLYCYCGYCQTRFQEWVKAKYGTLESLTEAWSWSTTNFVYNDWSDVSAPESMPSSWSGVTRWLDWRLFWQYAFAQFAGWQHDIIRGIDTQHPTSINTFNFKGLDRFGTYMGLDQWQIAEVVDHIGYDLYPGSGEKLKTRPEHNSMFLDHGRSVAAHTGRDFWIHEIESGPINGWVLGPEHDTDQQDVANYVFECLGHNAKLLLYMPWREWGYQPLHWGALVELDSTPTDRYEKASQIGQFIQSNTAFFQTAQPLPSEGVVLESKPNAIFFRGVEQEEALFAAQRGAYRALWDRGYSVDFVDMASFEVDDIARFRYALLPLVGLLSTNQAKVVHAYAERGGVVIGFARCGSLTERGWYAPQLPMPELGDLFGLTKIRPSTLNGLTIEWKGQSYQGWLNRDIVETRPTTEILARFTDGHPAVTLAKCGDGYGVYIATQGDAGNLIDGGHILSAVLAELELRLKVVPHIMMGNRSPRPNGIDPHFLDTPTQSMILFTNYSGQAVATSLQLSELHRQPADIYQTFPIRSSLDWQVAANLLTIPLYFEPKEVKAIQIDWK